MADWDPFAVEEVAPDAPAVALAGPDAGAGANGHIVKLTDRDVDRIIQEVMQKASGEKKWVSMSSAGKPDLSVQKSTAKEKAWKHTAISLEMKDQIAYIILNRPAEQNVIDKSFTAAWADAVYTLHTRPDIRVAVLAAKGPIFCAGGDLTLDDDAPADVMAAREALAKRAQENGVSGSKDFLERALGSKALWNFHTLPQLTIGVVTGSVLGGGLGLICACDTVISVKSALFMTSEVKVGTVPALTAPYICAKVGLGRAKKNISQGLSRTAEEAKADGMVQYVVEDIAEAGKVLQTLCDKASDLSPNGVSRTKEFVSGLTGRRVDMDMLYFSLQTLHELQAAPEAKLKDTSKKIVPVDLAKLLS
mmetsp:Transcript_2671/g.5880  ORF Transcript_2671/g.5880 Transcript_2671/m.5880 type:complete len:363 (-) Transcript_2671:40-1128(-)